MSTELMDEKTAYAAMYEFLVDYYERTKSDDVGALLGGMSLLPDGNPADPAIWPDWMNSVSKAKGQASDLSLDLKS
ncbi:hypothetical protein [Thiocystis violacea]|uniref:hypothetical protein n=1 Tax=Thiocystis violacea TaxID=13725 RepID=UPI001905B4A7|nr:hypothetical protein [Thiocystis violacea]MBK1725243.1 hypothetical protein [Thiocystis violacea]